MIYYTNYLKVSDILHMLYYTQCLKVSDILYKTTGCRNTPTKPQDPATEKNKEHIDQCTGKRTCVVPVEYITRPFLPRNPTGCSTSTQYQISVIYTCVPQGN